jgi:glycosyltransferase involved in cell wall biosynthesis
LQTGGAEKSLLEITRHFKRYNPVFVQLFDKSSMLKSEFDAAGIPVINVGLQQSYRFDQIAQTVWPHVQPLNPVIIHSTLFFSDMVSRKLPLQRSIPVINSFVNNSYSKQRYSVEPISIKIKLWLLQQWDAWSAKKVTAFISNSESIKQTNAHALGIPLSKIRVIYRGRSVEPFSKITEHQIQTLRHKLDAHDKKVFINVSRIIDRKGQLELVQAFHQVIQQEQACVLWIAGEGPYRKVLEAEITKLGLQAKVRLLGNRQDIPLLLKVADYFVFPSRYEGLPGALIEAMLAKIPIIASNIPENRECVNEAMALLHEAKNREGLAEQMMQAWKDENWPERTQKAFDYAMEHFEISKIAEQYEAFYDEVLGMK